MRQQSAAGVLIAPLVGGGVAAAGGYEAGEQRSHDYTQAQADRRHGGRAGRDGRWAGRRVERDGEDGATWEVEVTKTDGTTVDVRLDENYGVVVIEGDERSTDPDEDAGADAACAR